MGNRKTVIPLKPTPDDFKSARYISGLTQKQAGEVIFSNAGTHRTVQNWETGARNIPRGMYALFLLLTDQATLSEVRRETGILNVRTVLKEWKT